MRPFLILVLIAVIGGGSPASSADEVEVRMVIRDHRFHPDRLEVPAKTKVVLIVKNEDKEPEEFESPALRREKIVHPGHETRIVLGRIDPGEYPFYGEYHDATAKGVIVAK